MKFTLFHCFAFVTLLALQMSHYRLVVVGLLSSCIALFIGLSVMAFYSVRKFKPSNSIPQIAERFVVLALVNLVIVWAYFLSAGDPISQQLRAIVQSAVN